MTFLKETAFISVGVCILKDESFWLILVFFDQKLKVQSGHVFLGPPVPDTDVKRGRGRPCLAN